jgi:hypothetical protein
MANALFLGGILNITDPIIHLQLYYYLWVLIIVLAIVAWVIWYYGKWKPFAPLHGLYHAFKAGSNVAFIFDSNLIGEMVAEKDAKCIFDYSRWDYDLGALGFIQKKFFYYPTVFLDDIDFLHGIVYKLGKVNKDVEIARIHQNGEWERSPSAVCGGVPLDIVIDADNWTLRKSPQHKAIERVCSIWNEAHPDDQVHSYSKFQKKLLAGEIVCPEVKQDHEVSWTRIDAGFPMDLEESDWAGKRRQMAESLYDADQMSKNKMAIYVLIAGVGVAILVIVIRFVTFMMNHKV